MSSIEQLLNIIEDSEPIYITVPDSGDYLTIGAGTTFIDFYEGGITNSSGIRTPLRLSLKSRGKEVARSLYVYAEKPLKLSMNGLGKIGVESDTWFKLTRQSFRELYLFAEEETAVKVFASSAYDAQLDLKTGDKGIRFEHNRVTVTIIPTLISPLNRSRKSLIIYNNSGVGGATIYIGNSSVTAAGIHQGVPVQAGADAEILNTKGAVYGIVSLGTGLANCVEEY